MKKFRNKIYFHISALDSSILESVSMAVKIIPSEYKWNIIRCEKDSNKIGFLNYPDFMTNPHPILTHSLTVELHTMKWIYHKASEVNPPILHRKETFLNTSHENYAKFKKLTEAEERAGLLDRKISHLIGHKVQWEELLERKGFTFNDHKLISTISSR